MPFGLHAEESSGPLFGGSMEQKILHGDGKDISHTFEETKNHTCNCSIKLVVVEELTKIMQDTHDIVTEQKIAELLKKIQA